MGRRNNTDFIDPHWDEYVLQFLLDTKPEDMKFLTAADLRKIKKGKNLRRFVGTASLDEKLVLLAKTGMEFYLIAAPKDKWAGVSEMKGFFKKYFIDGINKPGRETTDKLVEDKVFVLGSPAILRASYFLHQSCQSDWFRINRTYQKMYNWWQMAGKNLGKNRTISDVQEVSKGIDTMTEIAFKLHKFEGIFANLGLSSQTDLTILLYLMRKNKNGDKRANFTEQHDMYNDINEGSYSPEGFGKRLFWLFQNGYIEKNAEIKTRPSYAISGRGTMVVMEYLGILVNKINIDL